MTQCTRRSVLEDHRHETENQRKFSRCRHVVILHATKMLRNKNYRFFSESFVVHGFRFQSKCRQCHPHLRNLHIRPVMIDCDWDALQCTNGLTSCVFQFRVIYSNFSSGSVPAVTLYLKSATQQPSTSILQDSHFDCSTLRLPRNVVDTCKLSGCRTVVLRGVRSPGIYRGGTEFDSRR